MIELDVIAVPAPQGSKSMVRHKDGGAHMIEGSSSTGRASLAAYRQAVAADARRYVAEHPGFVPLDGPLVMLLWAWLPRPASVTVKARKWPSVKPDLSKILRATEDALSKILYRDDALIVQHTTVKKYADGRPPGVHISIGQVDA